MPKYKETSIVGESWKRANQIVIDNSYNQTPRIRFSEEDVFVNSDGKTIISHRGEGVEESFTLENATTQFQLRNPETEEYINQYATYKDLYVLLHSLYFHLAQKRDRGPQPYPSWIYNEEINQWQAPVPMPDDGQNYVWKESTLSWELLGEE